MIEYAAGLHLPLAAAIAALLCLSAFFSASETAFFSIPRAAALELERGKRRERTAAKLLGDPRMLLVTILFCNLLVNIAATSAVTALAIGLYGERGVGIAAAVMTVLILFFGEITPKSLAMRRARSFAVAAAPFLGIVAAVLAPVRLVLGAIASRTVEGSRRLLGESREAYGARELATAVELGHRDGLFGAFEKQVLTNLFLFSEITAREVQTPRRDVFALDADTPLGEAVVAVRKRGFSRVPLVSAPGEEVAGILLAKDLLRFSRDDRVTLREIMRPAVFTPESKRIRDLFGELISSRQNIVVVVDEHGSFTGILTLEDILEEIFGEIRDRREPRVDEFIRLDDRRIVVEGALGLREVNALLGTDLESAEVETVAGYLVERVGRIPREGEAFEMDGLRFLVISADPVRVNKLKIERLAEEDGR